MPITMRTRRVTSGLRSAVKALQSSPRRVWCISFLFVTTLGAMWGLANPPFAGPDEPAHVIRAHALDHGELTGNEPRRQTERREAQGVLVVRAPAIYLSSAETLCFVFRRDVTASCEVFAGSSDDTDVVTSAARHPPAYYAVVGAVSWVDRPGSGTVYFMRFVGALIMGAFVATAITMLRRAPAPKLVGAGLLLAFTPMVLFVSGVVNPSVAEIAASLAFWVAGLVLVSGPHERVDNRLVTVLGIAGCTLALSRQLGPLWLTLIALTLLAMTSRPLLVNLARSNWARLWAGLILASALLQVAWNTYAKPLDASLTDQRTNVDTAEVFRQTFGATLGRVQEMIGVFGWLDTPSPALTWLPWIATIGFLFLLAIIWARRRDVVILLAILSVVIVVPVLLESARYEDADGFFWQGRYTLPLAVGLPILATIVLASTERGRQLVSRRLLFGIGIVVCVAHVLAFAQNLRRYTVGYDGEIQYWKHPEWSPPVSAILLTIGYTIVIIGFVWWVFASSGSAERSDASARRREERAPVDEPFAATVPSKG
jgi:Predicted membrane protein (DUF2142)